MYGRSHREGHRRKGRRSAGTKVFLLNWDDLNRVARPLFEIIAIACCLARRWLIFSGPEADCIRLY